MKLSEKLAKLEEVGIDTSKFKIKCNGLNIQLDESQTDKGEIDLEDVIVSLYKNKTSSSPCVESSVSISVDDLNDIIVESSKIVGNTYLLADVSQDKDVLVQTLRMINSERGFDKYLREKFSYMYQFTWIEQQLKKMVHMKLNSSEYKMYSAFIDKELLMALTKDLMKRIRNAEAFYLSKDIASNEIRDKALELAKDKTTNANDMLYYVLDILEIIKENGIEIDYSETKCSEWMDTYRGLVGLISLITLAKSYNVGCVKELSERLEKYKKNNTLYKFIRDLIIMDLSKVYFE